MDISDVGMERKADERAEDGGMKPFLPFHALHEESDDSTEAESASLTAGRSKTRSFDHSYNVKDACQA